MADDVTSGEIVRRLDELRRDVRNISNTYLSQGMWEEWRREAYDQRIRIIERGIAENKQVMDARTVEADRRYRTQVNLFVGAFLSIAGGAGLLVLQLVVR